MSDGARGSLVADGDSVLISGTEMLTRADVRRRADETLEQFARHHVRRALVLSDEPVDILRAIDASHRSGADLIVAHNTTAREHVEAVLGEFAVDMVIGPRDERLDSARAGAEAAGRIFTMTSGTTGAPKIAEHTLPSLLARVRAGGAGDGEPARWLLTYQPTGFAGLQVTLTALLSGGTIVLP